MDRKDRVSFFKTYCSDFAEQYKALRTAARLAYETNRTLVAPPFRLVSHHILDGSSDGKSLVGTSVDASMTSEMEEKGAWIDIPWSNLMDFERPRADFGIRIVDQTDHKWTGPIEWVHLSRSGAPASTLTLRNWFQRPFLRYSNHKQRNSDPKPTRLRQLQDLVGMSGRYVHCGILAASVFKHQLLVAEKQQVLQEALNRYLLLRPDRFAPLTTAADGMVRTLGGAGRFTSLTIHLAKYIGSGSNGGSNKRQQQPQTSTALLVITVADEHVLVRAMTDIILDVFSSIPIDQGVAAGLPIKDPLLSTLSRIPPWLATDPGSRRQLLQACIKYQDEVNQRYPIFFLTTTDLDLTSYPRIYRPLLESFPCIFTKSDMYHWGDVDSLWWQAAQSIASIQEYGEEGRENTSDLIDLEAVLAPIVDVMVSGRGYSHLEIPSSSLSSIISSLQQFNATVSDDSIDQN
ncbi:hypothetical protein BX666DRAFT_1413560 [Dichotomocladium elegans]|nr:hypothetical protein BX666DRAFT_1413560 [Dichotomocladium elegans]